MEGREKNAETQAGCHRHVLHRILAAASPKRKCDRLFKVTNPPAHTHLTRARCHGLLARSAATNICSMAAVLAHCSLLSSNPSFVARIALRACRAGTEGEGVSLIWWLLCTGGHGVMFEQNSQI